MVSPHSSSLTNSPRLNSSNPTQSSYSSSTSFSSSSSVHQPPDFLLPPFRPQIIPSVPGMAPFGSRESNPLPSISSITKNTNNNNYTNHNNNNNENIENYKAKFCKFRANGSDLNSPSLIDSHFKTFKNQNILNSDHSLKHNENDQNLECSHSSSSLIQSKIITDPNQIEKMNVSPSSPSSSTTSSSSVPSVPSFRSSFSEIISDSPVSSSSSSALQSPASSFPSLSNLRDWTPTKTSTSRSSSSENHLPFYSSTSSSSLLVSFPPWNHSSNHATNITTETFNATHPMSWESERAENSCHSEGEFETSEESRSGGEQNYLCDRFPSNVIQDYYYNNISSQNGNNSKESQNNSKYSSSNTTLSTTNHSSSSSSSSSSTSNSTEKEIFLSNEDSDYSSSEDPLEEFKDKEKLVEAIINYSAEEKTKGRSFNIECSQESSPSSKTLNYCKNHKYPLSKLSENNSTEEGEPKKREGPWTDEEHNYFLLGVQEYGWGKWREISNHFIKTRTRVQVATHAHKFLSKVKRTKLARHKSQTIKKQRKLQEKRAVSTALAK